MQKYYTLQIAYQNPDPTPGKEKLVEEFKDMSPGPDRQLDLWIDEVKRKLFIEGFKVQTADGAYLLIPGFCMFYARIIEQDKKFGI